MSKYPLSFVFAWLALGMGVACFLLSNIIIAHIWITTSWILFGITEVLETVKENE